MATGTNGSNQVSAQQTAQKSIQTERAPIQKNTQASAGFIHRMTDPVGVTEQEATQKTQQRSPLIEQFERIISLKQKLDSPIKAGHATNFHVQHNPALQEKAGKKSGRRSLAQSQKNADKRAREQLQQKRAHTDNSWRGRLMDHLFEKDLEDEKKLPKREDVTGHTRHKNRAQFADSTDSKDLQKNAKKDAENLVNNLHHDFCLLGHEKTGHDNDFAAHAVLFAGNRSTDEAIQRNIHEHTHAYDSTYHNVLNNYRHWERALYQKTVPELHSMECSIRAHELAIHQLQEEGPEGDYYTKCMTRELTQALYRIKNNYESFLAEQRSKLEYWQRLADGTTTADELKNHGNYV